MSEFYEHGLTGKDKIILYVNGKPICKLSEVTSFSLFTSHKLDETKASWVLKKKKYPLSGTDLVLLKINGLYWQFETRQPKS